MSDDKTRDCVVLLGASNLTRALPVVVETARRIRGGPCRFLVAAGYGRSFGISNRFMFRKLPGITGCGLWKDLTDASPQPTYALVTDIGNDIMYGCPPDTIVDWVRRCLDQLAERQARVVVSALPVRTVERLSPRRFGFFRRLLFPTQRISFAQTLAAVRKVDTALHELSAQRRLALSRHEPDWYGFDPIHIRRRYQAPAYRRILELWHDAPGENPPPATRSVPFHRSLRIRLMAPQTRRIFGCEQRRSQPASRMPDGSTIAMY